MHLPVFSSKLSLAELVTKEILKGGGIGWGQTVLLWVPTFIVAGEGARRLLLDI